MCYCLCPPLHCPRHTMACMLLPAAVPPLLPRPRGRLQALKQEVQAAMQVLEPTVPRAAAAAAASSSWASPPSHLPPSTHPHHSSPTSLPALVSEPSAVCCPVVGCCSHHPSSSPLLPPTYFLFSLAAVFGPPPQCGALAQTHGAVQQAALEAGVRQQQALACRQQAPLPAPGRHRVPCRQCLWHLHPPCLSWACRACPLRQICWAHPLEMAGWMPCTGRMR
mmetsp:Transcript_219/g.399  ORF Transcript_219/g.399 Transcript_219/m.399 type:complete len:222 (-) Transcript_219:114-779(-)